MKTWAATLFIMLIVLSGCHATHPENESAEQQQLQNKQVRAEQTVPPKPEIKNADEVSARLERLAESIPNVNDANCVVFGNTAIVGIDVNGELDRSKVGTIKYSVAEALRSDPYGVHAVVTADMDLNARLRELRQDIADGKPIAGFAEELSDIIGRIMPQLPRETLPHHRSDDDPQNNENKQMMDLQQ